MISVKLTLGDKEAIANRAVEASFAKEFSAMLKREQDLFKRCYNSVYSASDRRKISSLPDGWLDTMEGTVWTVGSMHLHLRSKGFFRKTSDFSHSRRVIKDKDLIVAVTRWAHDSEDIKNRRKAARAALMTLMFGLSTTKQLADAWPEGRQFIRTIPVAPKTLPAVQVAKINQMLGLKRAA